MSKVEVISRIDSSIMLGLYHAASRIRSLE